MSYFNQLCKSSTTPRPPSKLSMLVQKAMLIRQQKIAKICSRDSNRRYVIKKSVQERQIEPIVRCRGSTSRYVIKKSVQKRQIECRRQVSSLLINTTSTGQQCMLQKTTVLYEHQYAAISTTLTYRKISVRSHLSKSHLIFALKTARHFPDNYDKFTLSFRRFLLFGESSSHVPPTKLSTHIRNYS